MEGLNTKEFFEKLNAGTLKPSFSIKGVVKKSLKADEVLFSPEGSRPQWVKIPATMIQSVYVLAAIAADDGAATLVKLNLNPPATDEGKTLFELLSHHNREGHGQCGCGCKSIGCKCGCSDGGCKCGCQNGICQCGCQSKEQKVPASCCSV